MSQVSPSLSQHQALHDDMDKSKPIDYYFFFICILVYNAMPYRAAPSSAGRPIPNMSL
jgi:hypothetical protein